MSNIENLFSKNEFPWVTPNKHQWDTEKSYPKLSVIVPSYNQDIFLEETLLSIINQNYPDLELIVIDGGSTDNSVSIIKQYETHIAYWVSEKDRGQSHAINKGLEIATGEWVAWMNSDDCYLEGALYYIFNEIDYHQYDFLHGSCSSGISIKNRNCVIQEKNYKKTPFQLLLFFLAVKYIIPSQSVFIRKSILAKSGFIDEHLHYVMDMEWFYRIYKQTDRRFFYKNAICFYRHHVNAKSTKDVDLVKEESKAVAYSKWPDLNVWQRFILKRLIRDEQGLSSFVHYPDNQTIKKAIHTFFKYPVSALYNKHYWSVLKRVVIARS